MKERSKTKQRWAFSHKLVRLLLPEKASAGRFSVNWFLLRSLRQQRVSMQQWACYHETAWKQTKCGRMCTHRVFRLIMLLNAPEGTIFMTLPRMLLYVKSESQHYQSTAARHQDLTSLECEFKGVFWGWVTHSSSRRPRVAKAPVDMVPMLQSDRSLQIQITNSSASHAHAYKYALQLQVLIKYE